MVCALLLAPLAPAGASQQSRVERRTERLAPPIGPQCWMTRDIVQVETYFIEIESPSKSYKLGTDAVIQVHVTRPAHKDPAGQGINIDPPVTQPAEGVLVGIGLTAGKVFLFGQGKTDANGDASIKVKLEKYAPKGWADISAFGFTRDVETPCFIVEEYGYSVAPHLFKIT